MQMEAVRATIEEREIDFTESETLEQKFTVADWRRIEKAQKNLKPLPAKTPNFDDEMEFIVRRISNSIITKTLRDEFADFYLSDGTKSIEELDADFRTHEKLEQ